jgi:hypothetical protein
VDQRPPERWYERLLRQDSEAGPVIVVVLIVVVLVVILFVAPKLQQWIEGAPPSGYAPAAVYATVAASLTRA